MKNYLTILLAMLALLTVFCCAAENTDNTSDNTGSSNSPVGKWFSYENGQAFTLDYYDYRADGTVWLIQPAQPEYVDNWWNNPDVETSEQNGGIGKTTMLSITMAVLQQKVSLIFVSREI